MCVRVSITGGNNTFVDTWHKLCTLLYKCHEGNQNIFTLQSWSLKRMRGPTVFEMVKVNQKTKGLAWKSPNKNG